MKDVRKMKKAAFFDIDGTLYRNSLMIEHFRKLIKYEVIDPIQWHSHTKQLYEDWKKRRGNYDDYLLDLAQTYIKSLIGLNKEDINFITNQVINLKGDSVYAYTRKMINWHLNNGYLVFFISGSPDFLVEKMAEKYEITDFRATKYLTENNIFTGDVVQMWDSDSKEKAIMEFKENYDIDLGASYAYGDTNGDMSMFKLVGRAVAINPTNELICQIKSNKEIRDKTTIIVERKDVIYKLNADVERL
jgi:HAD superfamily hydrolase (TIGR01490 family)